MPAHLRSVVDRSSEVEIRVLLAADHATSRRALSALLELEGGIELVGVVEHLAALLSRMKRRRPHVVVLDLRISPGALTDNVRTVRQRSPATGVVIVTMYAARSFAESILDAGALGVVLKDSAERELGDAVRSAADGRRYTSALLG